MARHQLEKVLSNKIRRFLWCIESVQRLRENPIQEDEWVQKRLDYLIQHSKELSDEIRQNLGEGWVIVYFGSDSFVIRKLNKKGQVTVDGKKKKVKRIDTDILPMYQLEA